ncbi:MAG TPA: hypothetical protein VLY03_10730 [Bacteroidota bacterium]|nr:hypothetical protein [Bacteroidota bacterium]
MRTRILIWSSLICLLIPAVVTAQQQQPFVLTAYGGLFFPSNVDYKDNFKSTSDAIYGFGVGIPVAQQLYLIVDYSLFHVTASPDLPNDSSLVLDEHFWHVGLLVKQPLSPLLLLRFSAGTNIVTVQQTTSSASVASVTTEAPRKIGFFGGPGVEYRTSDPHLSFFGDIIYDYRHVTEKEMFGDFGGVRVVVGMHVTLF